jgi:ABC-2 type transport system ATP-binding protein
MGSVVRVRDLAKRYGKVIAVDGISLDVEEGEIFGMVGPNGAGKTTTIECMEGLRRPDSGELEILGLDPVKDERKLRFLVGAQLQKSQLPERMRVGEAMRLFSSFYPEPAPWRELLERLGLAEKETSFVSKLSGGQLQRLFIALALVNKPRLVFLDELTTGLDPQARHGVWDLVREVRAGGCTVFLTTHFMDEAQLLCDRVAIIDRGRVVALDGPAALVRDLGRGSRIIATLTVSSMPNDLARRLGAIPDVTGTELEGTRLTVRGRKSPPGSPPLISAVAEALAAAGAAYQDIRTEEASLEDVFLSLTGRAMRD